MQANHSAHIHALHRKPEEQPEANKRRNVLGQTYHDLHTGAVAFLASYEGISWPSPPLAIFAYYVLVDGHAARGTVVYLQTDRNGTAFSALSRVDTLAAQD